MSLFEEPKPKTDEQQFLDDQVLPAVQQSYKNIDESYKHAFKTDFDSGKHLLLEAKKRTKEFAEQKLHEVANALPNTPKDQWGELLDDVIKDMAQYEAIISVEIQRIANEDGELTEEQVATLTKRVQGIAKMMEKGKLPGIYDKIIGNIKLTNGDYDEIVRNMKGHKIEEGKPLDVVKNFELANTSAIVAAMSPAQRFELAKHFIDSTEKSGQEKEQFIRAFLAANLLDISQGTQIWKAEWGEFPAEKIAAQQRALAEVQEQLRENNYGTNDDSNLMEKIFRGPKLIGGALQIWRGTNMFLNIFPHVYKSMKGQANMADLFKNPWIYVDTAGIAFGRQIARGRILPDFLKKGPKAQEEADEQAREVAHMKDLLMRYPDFYASYFDKGGAEVVAGIIAQKREDKRDLTLTLKEVLDAENALASTDANDTARKEYLQKLMLDSEKRMAANDFFTQMAKTTRFTEAADLKQMYEEARKERGLT